MTIEGIDTLTAVTAILSFSVMSRSDLMFGFVVLRYIGSDDIAAWLCAASAFLALGHTFRHGEMIRVGLLIDKMPEKSRHWVELGCLVIGTGFIAFFAYNAVKMNYQSYLFGDMSQGVVLVPMWIPQIGYSLGLVILLIAPPLASGQTPPNTPSAQAGQNVHS